MMADVAKLLAIAKSNPEEVCDVLRVVVDGLVEDPKVFVDALTLLEGGSVTTFARQHPIYAAKLMTALSTHILRDPSLFKELLEVLT